MKFPIEGACQCGQLTYQLFDKPKAVWACHCTECQKLSTSAFSVTAIISATAIKFSGKLNEWSRTADSGNKNNAKFCPNCGNRVYHYNPEDSETVKLKLKPVNLKDHGIFEPSVHVWVGEKLNWTQIPAGVEVFEKQP